MSAVSRKQIAGIIADKIASAKDTASVARELAAYLVTERRTRELDAIMRDVARLRYERSGVLEITATSAFPLSEQVVAEIKELFGAKKSVMNNQVDKRVLGGVRVKALDRQADLTVARQLQDFKRKVAA